MIDIYNFLMKIRDKKKVLMNIDDFINIRKNNPWIIFKAKPINIILNNKCYCSLNNCDIYANRDVLPGELLFDF